MMWFMQMVLQRKSRYVYPSLLFRLWIVQGSGFLLLTSCFRFCQLDKSVRTAADLVNAFISRAREIARSGNPFHASKLSLLTLLRPAYAF